MYIDKGQVVELILENGIRYARISCVVNLIPSPGQYLQAGTASQSDPLPVSLFSTETGTESFIACAPIPEHWTPGTEVTLRGPLGHGYVLPASVRKIALIAFDDSPSRLLGLMRIALSQDAAVVLVCDSDEVRTPDEVEVQPLSALRDAWEWAEYIAVDVSRENLRGMKEVLEGKNQPSIKKDAQALIRTPMPCGGIAECGICAVTCKSGWRMSCKDGPVFDWDEI